MSDDTANLNRIPEPRQYHSNEDFLNRGMDEIRELRAAVTRLKEQLTTTQADAWDEGWGAADINRPTSRKGHWDSSSRKCYRTWIPDPLPANPYRATPEEDNA
jgi:hypothetical protein